MIRPCSLFSSANRSRKIFIRFLGGFATQVFAIQLQFNWFSSAGPIWLPTTFLVAVWPGFIGIYEFKQTRAAIESVEKQRRNSNIATFLEIQSSRILCTKDTEKPYLNLLLTACCTQLTHILIAKQNNDTSRRPNEVQPMPLDRFLCRNAKSRRQQAEGWGWGRWSEL